MVVTIEQVERRLAELQRQYDQLMADGNAMTGAIQDCNYWLAFLRAEEIHDEDSVPAGFSQSVHE